MLIKFRNLIFVILTILGSLSGYQDAFPGQRHYSDKLISARSNGYRMIAKNYINNGVNSGNNDNPSSQDSISNNQNASQNNMVSGQSDGADCTKPVQYCRGKYKIPSDSGVEIINVKCPEVTDKCSCEVDIKRFTEYVECGGIRKYAGKGSELRECDTLIPGN